MQPNSKFSNIAWKTGFWIRAPWDAFAELLGFAVCCGCLVLILFSSDGEPIRSWPVPSETVPVSSMLSFVIGLGNLCLRTALSKGYEIAWWTQAIQGAELRKLHFDLDVQRRILAVFSRNASFDRFTVAAVVSLLVGIINGPLLQKASSITAQSYGLPLLSCNVNTSVASLPADFSSLARGGSGSDIFPPLFSNVSRAYSNRDAIHLAVENCGTNTTCEFTLPAPGFDVSCVDVPLPYDFDNLASAGFGDQTLGPPVKPLGNQITTFGVDISFGGLHDFSHYSTVNTTIRHKPQAACSGHITKTECVFRPAIVKYPVTLTDGIATIESWRPGQNETLQITQPTDPGPWPARDVLFVEQGAYEPFGSMLGGISYVLNHQYSSHLSLRIDAKGDGYSINTTGQAGNNHLNSDLSTYNYCNMTWGSPLVDIVNIARELMFRSTIAYAQSNLTAIARHEVTMLRTEVLASYKTDYMYLVAALVCMVLQALAIISLLFRWQILGRKLSLDPFEIALALDAPLLRSDSSRSDLGQILTRLSTRRSRYGEILPGHTAYKSESVPVERTFKEINGSTMPYEAVHLVESNTAFDTGLEHESRLGLDLEEKTISLML